jgi:hypothetical protein
MLAMAPAVARAEVKSEPLYEISLDLDDDGIADRAVLVLNGPGRTDFGPLTSERFGLFEDESVDLYIYLGLGDARVDLSKPPSFVKKAIVDTERTNWVQPLESNERGSLQAIFVYGWGASKTWGEMLTIVFRGGEFLVGGYSKDWDWNTHLADGTVETTMGGCDINYLTGKAVLSNDLDETRPMHGTFKPVKLADWSYALVPEGCDF